MSQVASRGKINSKQPGELQDSIESEQARGNRNKKKATSARAKQESESGGRKALDSFTLIDAAKQAEATATAPATGKDHREPQAADPVQRGAGGTAAKAITKSTAVPADKFGDKFDALDHHHHHHQVSEVNNNSIPASESQIISSSSPTSTRSAKTNQTELTPHSLLTGLRMHTSHLKSQQQKQQEQQQGQPIQQQQSGTTQAGADDSGDQKKVPIKGDKQVQDANSKVSTAKSSPVPFVESSLSPQESPIGAYTSASSLSPRQRSDNKTAYIPSYTSIFNYSGKPANNTPASISSPLSSPDNLDSHKLSTTSSVQKHHLLSESSTIRQTTTTATTTATSRAPLVKQQATAITPRELSPRSLFLTSTTSKSSLINTNKSDIQRLPSIFDHSSGRLKEPTDYDDCLSAKCPDERLVDGGVDDIIDYDDDDNQSGGQDFNSVRADRQRFSPDSYTLNKTGRNLANNLRTNERSSLINSKYSTGEPKLSVSPEFAYQQQHKQQKQPHNQLNYHQTPKYPGSSSRLSQPSLSNRSARADSSLKLKMSQAQKQGSKKYQQQQLPQEQHTKITMNELSRPPSFNTTTCQQQQEHNIKMASCRKLDLLEQVAHLDCNCEICSRSREIASIHNNDLFHHNSGSRSKLSNFNLNSQGKKNYPRTRFVHMVLKSIILVLCLLLLLLLLVGTILISHYLPQSMEKVMNVSRSFNVTIAGRR